MVTVSAGPRNVWKHVLLMMARVVYLLTLACGGNNMIIVECEHVILCRSLLFAFVMRNRLYMASPNHAPPPPPPPIHHRGGSHERDGARPVGPILRSSGARSRLPCASPSTTPSSTT